MAVSVPGGSASASARTCFCPLLDAVLQGCFLFETTPHVATPLKKAGAQLAFSSPIDTQSLAVPKFMKQTYPDQALQGAWSDYQAVFGKDGAVPQKYKELIALGVAAQVPCQYCVYAHTLGAKKHGATDAEIKEAIAAAALVRQWSTVLNGSAYDMSEFKAELGPTN
jgi:AhpD family alkylhydroperoxidase